MSSGLSDSDIAAITSMADAWDEAGRTGDRSVALETIADDFVFAMPESPVIVGKAAWLEFVAPFPPIEQTTTIEEVEGSGDVAYVWGRSAMNIDGEADANTARFLLIMRKQGDGSWLCTREMMTFEKPLAVPG